MAISPMALGAIGGGILGGLGGSKQKNVDLPPWLRNYANFGFEGLKGAPTSPVGMEGTNYFLDVLQGDYLDSNPFLDRMFDRASGKVQAGVDSAFSRAGRTGSGAHQGVLGDTLSNLATDIYGQNFTRERGFQQQAGLGSMDFATSPFRSILSGVGGIASQTQPYFQNKPGEILSGVLGGAMLGRGFGGGNMDWTGFPW